MNIRHRLAVEQADSLRRELGIGWTEEYKEEILDALQRKDKYAINVIVFKSVSEVQYVQLQKYRKEKCKDYESGEE